jgi:hypothetical protein
VSASEDEDAIEAVAGTVRTQRSANAFAFGARMGVRITSIPSERKISSKARLNLESRSWISSRNCGSRSPSCMARLRACWVTQAQYGLAVQAMNSRVRGSAGRLRSFKGRVERMGNQPDGREAGRAVFEVSFETHPRRPEPAAADRTLVDLVLRNLE